MVKYTLFFDPGSGGRGVYYLIFGYWINYDPGRVILQHGMLSDADANVYQARNKVAIFDDCRYHRLSILEEYNRQYRQRVSTEDLKQFVGYLEQDPDEPNLYKGVLNIHEN